MQAAAELVREAVREMRRQLDAIETASHRTDGPELFRKVIEDAVPSCMQLAVLDGRCRELLEWLQESVKKAG